MSMLKEIPSAWAMLSDGRIEIGSRAHIAIIEIIDTIVFLSENGLLTAKEKDALAGVLSGMTAPQSRSMLGGKSNESVQKLRSRSIGKVREVINERKGT